MRSFRLTISLLAIGVILGFFGGRGLVASVLPPKYIYADDCDWTKLKGGQRVVAELDFVLEPLKRQPKTEKASAAFILFPI